MINFLNLEYFVVAAEELNFTKAAKRLYISQQSLSNHIAHMEQEFGVTLFNRTTPLTLTYAGQRLLARSRILLDCKAETYHELEDIKDFSTGQLSIGISHTRGRFILPLILPAYKIRYPHIDLKLFEGNSHELDKLLLHGDADLIIGLPPFHVQDVEIVPICREEILMAVPESVLKKYFPDNTEHVRQKLQDNSGLSLLNNCPFVMLRSGNRVRTIANEVLTEAQVTPNIVLEAENIETVMALAEKGMGITFYPKMFACGPSGKPHGSHSFRSLTLCPLKHPMAHSTLAIGYHKSHYMSQATKEFIKMTQELFSDYNF